MNEQVESNRQLKYGALLSYLAIGINVISALVYSPWMLSKIGSADYGLYTLASSVINMFLLDFGISSAVARFASKYVAEGQQDKLNNLIGVVYKLFFAISALISIGLTVVYFFVDQIYVSLTPDELEKFKVIYIIAATFSVVSLPFSTALNGILTAYEKFIQMKLCDVGNKVITVLLIVGALLIGGGLYELVAINAMVNLGVYAAKMLIIKRSTALRVNFRCRDKKILKEIFGFSVWVLINSICSRLIMNICPNILGVTAGTTAITIFSFSSVIEGYAYTFSSAIDGMFVPRIAKIVYKQGDRSKILPLMIKVGRFQYCVVGLILVGFICVGKEFIVLWIGEGFVDVYYGALLLLLPAPFYLSQHIGKSAMVMTNNVKYLTYVNVIKAVLNVILVSILSMYWGAIGACLSICVVYFFRNSANLYLYKKYLNIDIKLFCGQCYLIMAGVMLGVLCFGLALNYLWSVKNWGGLIVKSLGVMMVYFMAMWKVAFNEEEHKYIMTVIKRFGIR